MEATAEIPTPSTKEIELKSGEKVQLPTVHIDKKTLYHGSPITEIEKFKDSVETTVGDGVYLTSSPEAARGYAIVRGRIGEPTYLYESEITDVELADLTTTAGIESFAQLLKEEIIEWQKRVIAKGKIDITEHYMFENASNLVKQIDEHKIKNMKQIAFNFGDWVRRILLNHGYSGLMAKEGGESGNGVTIGDHDSYVIFEPEKVKIISHEPVKI